MTDLELTRLCAEAMFDRLEWEQRLFNYDPLHDDAQAMALVKKFRLLIELNPNILGRQVRVSGSEIASDIPPFDKCNYETALNRAICECVAKMQAAK